MKRFLTIILLTVLMSPLAVRAQADSVNSVYARKLDANNVEVVWGWDKIIPQSTVVDFETGDFSQAEITNDSEFPWVITEDAYEGTYAAKSSNAGQHGTKSVLEMEVEVPYDGVMSFWHKIESEWMWDGGIFYVDGAPKASLSGFYDWQFVSIPITAGVHTYRWEYEKDDEMDEGDVGVDAYYLDQIVPFAPYEEIAGGWLHYDDGVFSNAAGMGAVGADNYWAVSFPDMTQYAGKTLTKVATMIYQGSNVTATVCLGGTDAPGTVMSTKSFTATPNQVVEVELDTPVAIDGTQPLWIVMYCNDGGHPSAASQYCGDPNSSWFLYNDQWAPTSDWGLSPMTWIIRGFVEDAEGRTMAISQGEFVPVSTASANGELTTVTPERRRIFGTPNRIFRNDGYSYNVYKRNNFTGAEAELLVENHADTIYIDNTWETTEHGVYQWGVQIASNNSRGANRGVLMFEGFEDFDLPEGWLSVTGPGGFGGFEWIVSSALNGGFGSTYEGNYVVKSESVSDGHYYLITSAVDLTDVENPQLSFYYQMPGWSGDNDCLSVLVSSSQEGPWNQVWTSGFTDVPNWTQAVVDLSEYAGQTIYLNFDTEKGYGYGCAMDNITVTYGEDNIGGGDDDEPVPAPIVWSNVIEKDMFTEVDVTVTTNDNHVYGATVSFVNISEPGAGYDYSVDLPSTGKYAWDKFRVGTYDLTISKAGYESDTDHKIVEITDAQSFTCNLTEIMTPATQLYVSPTGFAKWEGLDVVTQGDEFVFDFENGTTEGWITYDVDGDGRTWANTNEILLEPEGYQSSNSVLSASFDNDEGALYPDNYMITSEKYLIGETSQLIFMVKPLDPAWVAEHYGIAVSTEGNTSTNDFEMVWEETISFSGWELRTVDLGKYAGQEVYIALRHFDCTDNYMILIDDVNLVNKPLRVINSYTVSLNGTVVAENVVPKYYQHEDITPGETYTTTVVANYNTGDSEAVEYTWTCVACDEYEGATDFSAEYSNGNAVLTWTMPETGQSAEWMQYDDGNYFQCIGMTTSDNMGAAVMFPAEEMNTTGILSKVSMYDAVVSTGNIFIYLGGDTAPGTLITTQPYETTDANTFVEFELLEPVTVDGTQNLWIVFRTTSYTQYAFPMSQNESSHNARWVELGGNWMDVQVVYQGYALSFQIRGYIEGGNVLRGVLVYRDGELVTEKPVTTGSYTEAFVDDNAHEYCIRVVHNDYGMSCEQCEEVEPVSIGENVADGITVYPNPVKDNLRIEAEAMTRVVVANALGQIMYDEEVVDNAHVINVAQFEAGVYVVRIVTEAGVAVERVTVVK